MCTRSSRSFSSERSDSKLAPSSWLARCSSTVRLATSASSCSWCWRSSASNSSRCRSAVTRSVTSQLMPTMRTARPLASRITCPSPRKMRTAPSRLRTRKSVRYLRSPRNAAVTSAVERSRSSATRLARPRVIGATEVFPAHAVQRIQLESSHTRRSSSTCQSQMPRPPASIASCRRSSLSRARHHWRSGRRRSV